MNPRPLRTPMQAIAIARKLVGTGIYQLGTGDVDTPDGDKSDCFGFAVNKCYGIRRHRPGFNHGQWATVSDDLNSNSAIEDARYKQDLFEVAPRPEVGGLIAYPSITLLVAGKVKKFVGHAAIIDKVPAEWDEENPDYSLLGIIQCVGPNGRKPGILRSTGIHFNVHDQNWPLHNHKAWLLRVKP